MKSLKLELISHLKHSSLVPKCSVTTLLSVLLNNFLYSDPHWKSKMFLTFSEEVLNSKHMLSCRRELPSLRKRNQTILSVSIQKIFHFCNILASCVKRSHYDSLDTSSFLLARYFSHWAFRIFLWPHNRNNVNLVSLIQRLSFINVYTFYHNQHSFSSVIAKSPQYPSLKSREQFKIILSVVPSNHLLLNLPPQLRVYSQSKHLVFPIVMPHSVNLHRAT